MATIKSKTTAAETVKDAGVVDQQSAAAPAQDATGANEFTSDLSETAAPRSGVRGLSANVFGQASDKARDYANQGKDAATGRLNDFAGLVSGLADSLGDKLGPQTGDYARRAADTVSKFAEGLKGRDVDDLVDDTRRIIKQNPAMAIGAAAALGFILVRLAKAGGNDNDEA